MARKTITSYECDVCGIAVSKPGDLRKVHVRVNKAGYVKGAIEFDACEDCQDGLADFLASKGIDEANLRRENE